MTLSGTIAVLDLTLFDELPMLIVLWLLILHLLREYKGKKLLQMTVIERLTSTAMNAIIPVSLGDRVRG